MIYKSFLIENNINLLKNHITIFYGENLGLKQSLKKALKKKFLFSSQESLTQEEIIKDQNNFYSSFLNSSLFSNEKIYFIDSVDDKILDLIEDIKNKIDDNKIFMFADKLDKKSKLRNYFEKSKEFAIIPCYADNEINLKKIVLESLKHFEGINPHIIDLIVKNSNLDRIKLNNEISKIETYFYKRKITEIELLDLLNLKENDDFDLIKDAALSGNVKEMAHLLNSTYIQEEKTIYYINSINQRLRKLYEILSIKDKSIEHIIDNIKPPIFWKDKKKVLEQTRRWDLNKINHVLKEIFSFELRFKSKSDLNKKTLMKKILIDICIFANS